MLVRSLHICYVELGYPHHHGGGGGAGTYVQLVGKELVRQGHRVSVITAACLECPFHTVDDGVDVYRPKLGSALHWYIGKLPGLRVGALSIRYLEQGAYLYRFLKQVHKKQPIDLVEYAEGGDFWHAWRPLSPYIVHLHGSRYTSLRMSGKAIGRADWYHRRLELSFIRRARHIISPSQALLDIVTDETEYRLDGATVIPYPLDSRLLATSRRATTSSGGVPTVLFAARNDPLKGAETLLRSVPLIRRSVADVEFQLFGYSPLPGAELPNYVRCFSFVTKEELLRHYQTADICVVPSLWDNSPNTLYEAMAAGKAVVASRVGGIPEIVADGETGILVGPNDAEQLAEAIIRLLTHERERLAMGVSGRERIRQLADPQANLRSRLEIYQRVAHSASLSANTRERYAHRAR